MALLCVQCDDSVTNYTMCNQGGCYKISLCTELPRSENLSNDDDCTIFAGVTEYWKNKILAINKLKLAGVIGWAILFGAK